MTKVTPEVEAKANELKAHVCDLYNAYATLGRQSSVALWKAGKALCDVQTLLKPFKGAFDAWLAEAKIARSTAYQAIKVAKHCTEKQAAKHPITELKTAIGITKKKTGKSKKDKTTAVKEDGMLLSLAKICHELDRVAQMEAGEDQQQMAKLINEAFAKLAILQTRMVANAA